MATILERVLPGRKKSVQANVSGPFRSSRKFPGLTEPHRTGERGRPSSLPVLMERIHETPEGQPVVLKTAYGYPASLYYHRKKLRGEEVEAIVVSPNTQRRIGGHVVTNISEYKYLLVGIGTSKENYTPMCVNIQVV